jgi:glycerol-3-phosphate dehydrogenase (NAD(P)+)
MTQTHRPPRWLVLGAGSFGTAFARVLGHQRLRVTVAARDERHVAELRAAHTNERYFPGIRFPERTHFATFDEAEQHDWDAIVLAVPTGAFVPVLQRFADKAPVLLSLAKGLDPSGRRLSEAAAEHVDPDRLVVLSGPNIAREIMLDLPTTAVVAGHDMATVERVQAAINCFSFRVYAQTDIIGVELAGATKNVVAIACGVGDAAGFGTNGVASLFTRGLGEMARLGLAQGASLQTYLGLAGVGDLMTTVASPHSRNHRAGRLLAKGHTPDEVRAEIGQAVEGLRTAPIMRQMAREAGLSLTICESVAGLLEGAVDLSEIARRALGREPGLEFSSPHVFGT